MTVSPQHRSRRRRLLEAGIAAVAALASFAVLPPSAEAATGQITGLGGKCVDIDAASSANGTQVQLYACNGTAAQSWTVGSDGTVRALGKCLDVAAASSADGAKVQIYDCNGTTAQKWTSNPDGSLRALGKCLDAKDRSSADRTPLQLWTCTGGTNQKWTLPGGTTQPPSGAAGMAAAPYLYTGWGSPPDPQTVQSATGVRWFTMAFMLSNGGCTPAWDGYRALTNSQDMTAINRIRAGGGDVVVSFGGASGTMLEQACSSASALAGAYQQVINGLQLKAIDIDIEGGAYGNSTVQQRTVDALKTVKANNPGLTVYVTFPSDQSGPDASLINRAASSGLTVDGWTIMPFDFGAGNANMGSLTIQATDGLKNRVKAAYGYSDDVAYRHSGISSMNGLTDVGEHVYVSDFQTMLSYATAHHLARFTFWSANRDRPCGSGGGGDDTCSGVSQSNWDFTRVIAQYRG